MRRRLTGFLLACICVSEAAPSEAQDVDFHYREEGIFRDVSFDSGWVPPGSPIQLRIVFFLGGNTEIDMGGTVLTSWPAPITVEVPGRPGTGALRMDYGIEVAVMLRFDVTVAGVRYTWTGNIPIPELPEDIRMTDESGFDPWLLPGALVRPVTVRDTTEPVPVVRYDALGGLIPVPGVGGGIAVTLQGDLTVGYQSDRIVVGDARPIEMEGATTVTGPDAHDGEGFGPAKDVVLHPEGTLFFDGVLIASPTLYLTFAGSRMDYPLAMIPIPVADVASDVIFDDQMVHVPLPDIRLTPTAVDFGAIDAGTTAEQIVTVANDGEAELVVTIREPAAPFVVEPTAITLPPRTEGRITVRYAPPMAGADAAMVFVESNDPDESLLVLRLSGEATGAELPVSDAGAPDAGPVAGPGSEGGCGCRTAPARRSPGFALVAPFAILLVIRRAVRRPRGSARARSRSASSTPRS